MSYVRNAWAHLRYQWDHGEHWWAAAHAFADDVHARLRTVDRRIAGDLVIGYRGYRAGLRHVMPFLAEQLARNDKDGARPPVTGEAPDIVFFGCSHRRVHQLADGASMVLPFRVQQLITVVPDAAAMRARVSRSERRQFSLLRRKHDWTLTVGTRDDLAFFYERMHLPTMDSRHGEATRSTDWTTARECLFERGMLFFIEEQGRRVAGVLCRRDDDGRTLRMRLLGVLDGDEQHYRSGAVKAIWYLAVEWASENGVDLIDMSGGEPFPGKGVFQFKRRLHPVTTLPTDHFGAKRLCMRVLRDTDAVRDFLVATPMLAIDEAGRLTAVHFFDDQRAANTRIVGVGPGIERSVQIDLGEFLRGLNRVSDRPARVA